MTDSNRVSKEDLSITAIEEETTQQYNLMSTGVVVCMSQENCSSSFILKEML
jgi:hypothetical protein